MNARKVLDLINEAMSISEGSKVEGATATYFYNDGEDAGVWTFSSDDVFDKGVKCIKSFASKNKRTIKKVKIISKKVLVYYGPGESEVYQIIDDMFDELKDCGFKIIDLTT